MMLMGFLFRADLVKGGIKGKVQAAKYARENRILFGLMFRNAGGCY